MSSLNLQQDDHRGTQGDNGTRLASTLEDNRFDMHHSDNDTDDFARYGRLRMGAHKYAGKCFAGFCTHRELAVGRHFELADPEHRQFTLVGLACKVFQVSQTCYRCSAKRFDERYAFQQKSGVRDSKFNNSHYASRIGNLSTTICRMNPNTNKVFVTV
jgi:uncharacterized protein involved in type VI secretion and phage assembly